MTQENFGEKIAEIKEEKNGVLLAHNYQITEVQKEADYLGDSLGLARKSAETDADVVVFAGTDFMAETAAILNPDKKILLPDNEASCPMAGMLPAEKVREAKKKHPEAAVVLYVNTLAEARAEADVTCTSSNSIDVVKALDEDKVIFGPDENLGWHIKRNTDKEIILVPDDGHCYVHRQFSKEDVNILKEKHPEAEILIHPESKPEVQKAADYICSTSQMFERAKKSTADEFIIGTEVGLVERLRREFPDKEFYPLLENTICEEMKKHNLEKIYNSFEKEQYLVKVPKDIAEKAKKATEKMLKLSP